MQNRTIHEKKLNLVGSENYLCASKDLKLLRSFGPTALVRRLVPAPGLDG